VQSPRLVAAFRAAFRAALCASLLASPLAAQSGTPASCPTGKVALVLPGGGVLGFAHVGVIQMLDSLGVFPDLIVGTSMGSIIGALYASGYTGQEIDSISRKYNVGPYIGRYSPRAPAALGLVPPLLTWEQGEGTALQLQTAAVDESKINTLISAMMMRGNIIARGDFDQLPIPYRAVATDVATGGRVVIGSGDLARAVRASFAIPIVFQPVEVDGKTLVDGGLVENTPLKVARDMGVAYAIVSELDGGSGPSGNLSSPGSVAMRMVDLLFKANPPQFDSVDVRTKSDVSGYSNLDFSDATIVKIIERGRNAARVLASNTCLPRRPRPVKPLPPIARGQPQEVLTERERSFLRREFGVRPGESVDIDAMQLGVTNLSETELVRGIWLNPEPKGDSVIFRPDLVLAGRRFMGGGLAIDSDLGARVWLGYVDRSFLNKGLEAALRGTLGEFRRDVGVALRPSYHLGKRVVRPFTNVIYGREFVRLFSDDGLEVPNDLLPDIREAVVQAGYDEQLGTRWTGQLNLLYRGWEGDTLKKDAEFTSAYGLMGRVASTLGVTNYTLRGVIEVTTEYTRGEALLSSVRERGLLRYTGSLSLGAGTNGTPLHIRFPLGGSDGFAGYHIGEKLGLSEATATLDLAYPLFGPLRLHASVMGGTSHDDPSQPFGGAWRIGSRVGAGMESPIGPVRLQYGLNSQGRSLWFLRIGSWF
jgi:predicted acylesterase/phospholipase RssA